jgi:hypothetical protein
VRREAACRERSDGGSADSEGFAGVCGREKKVAAKEFRGNSFAAGFVRIGSDRVGKSAESRFAAGGFCFTKSILAQSV